MSLLTATIDHVHPLSPGHIKQAHARMDTQTKPQGSLGILEDIAARLVAITSGGTPCIDPARIYTCAGDHGVAQQGVSAFPQTVTRQMVENFMSGGAAINVLTQVANIELRVVDSGCVGGHFPEQEHLVQCKVASGTADFTTTSAMSTEHCLQALENGITLARLAHKEGVKALGTGEMGIANTTAATALFCAYLDLAPETITGPGTGLSQEGIQHKIQTIKKALALHKNTIQSKDPLTILAALGGFEIATLSGMILGGASLGMPLVIDGFIATSAFVAAQAFCPVVKEYAFFAHNSAEPGYKTIIDSINAKPLLHLGLRLGEGTGAALAFFLLRSAAKLYTDMATFSEAGVSPGNK